MTLDELNKLVRDIINVLGISTHDAIKYAPNAPRPAEDYATVYCAEGTRIGQQDVEYSTNGDDLDETVIRQHEQRVSVNFYRANANQNAEMLGSSMGMNSILEMLNAAKVGFSRSSAVRDLTQVFNSSHEERAQVDLFLTFELTPIVGQVTGIDTARVVGDIDNSVEVIETVDIETP